MDRELETIRWVLVNYGPREARIQFDRSITRLRPHWDRLAKWLLTKWKAPVSVLSEEDLVQELMVGTWIAIRDYDPSRLTRLKDYVVYNSVDKAKKHLHTQRKALRRDDRAPSRLLIPVSALGKDGEEPIDIAELLPVIAQQDRQTELVRHIEKLPSVMLPPVREFLRQGSISDAAWGLLEGPERAYVGFLTYPEAHRLIENALGMILENRAWEMMENQIVRERHGFVSINEAKRSLISMVA